MVDDKNVIMTKNEIHIMGRDQLCKNFLILILAIIFFKLGAADSIWAVLIIGGLEYFFSVLVLNYLGGIGDHNEFHSLDNSKKIKIAKTMIKTNLSVIAWGVLFLSSVLISNFNVVKLVKPYLGF